MANAPGMSSGGDQPFSHGERGDGGLRQQLAGALEPVIAQVYQQIARIAQEQADRAVEPARDALARYGDQVIDTTYASARQQVDQALGPLQAALMEQVGQALDPARTMLRGQVDQTLHSLLYGRSDLSTKKEARSDRGTSHRTSLVGRQEAHRDGEDAKASASSTPPASKQVSHASEKKSSSRASGKKSASAASKTSNTSKAASSASASADEDKAHSDQKVSRSAASRSSSRKRSSSARGEATGKR